MARILYPDGSSKEVRPANGTDFRLKELREIVGGSIEILSLKDGRIMVLNESGKLLDLPYNEQASELVDFPSPAEVAKLLLAHPEIVFIGDLSGDEDDYIAGTVLVCQSEEVQ